MPALAEPQLEVDQHFEEIAKNFTVVDLDALVRPEEDRITVMLDLPHLKDYGRPTTVELVYGCSFPVKVGDAVLCPPTPRGDNKWTTGVVTALDGKGYKGPVKYVRKVSSPGNSDGAP